MSLAHLGKMEWFGGGYTFSKGLLPRAECNFIIILKANVREVGGGWGLESHVLFQIFSLVRLFRVKNPVADKLAL